MKIKVGAVIKELRIKNRITQESLAVYLGVTPQAVSRWESETGYPDIELLPSIASFFSVTVDDLLGINQTERNERLEEIHKEIDHLWNFDLPEEEIIPKARKFAEEFPADETIQTFLASKLCVVCLRKNEPDRELLRETERILKALIENADVSNTLGIHKRNVNIERLAALYAVCFKDMTKVRSTLDMLSTLITCREAVAARVYGLVGKTEYRKAWIYNLLNSFYTAVANEAAYNIPENNEEKNSNIRRLEHLESLIALIYTDEMADKYLSIGTLNRFIAIYRASQGEKEKTLAALEEMCDNYIAVNCLNKNNMVKAERLPSVVNCYNPTKFQTVRELLQDKLNQERYNFIRQDERFKMILKRIGEIEY